METQMQIVEYLHTLHSYYTTKNIDFFVCLYLMLLSQLHRLYSVKF